MRIFLCLFLSSQAADVSPVQKVIELLGENKMKILKDLESEEKEMAAYSQMCDDESKARTYAIETATQTIATLEAAIEDTNAQIEGLADDIAKLGSEIAGKDADLAKASGIRKTEKTDFEKDEGELVKSIDQLERAVVMIKRGTAFVQSDKNSKVDPKKAMEATMKVFSEILDANRVNAGMRKMLKQFVQTSDSNGEDEYQKLGQPQPTVKNYESSSGGIVGELESMKEKAEETLSDTRMAEMRKQHNFDTFAQSLTDGLKIAGDKLADSKKGKAAATEAAGKAKAELVEATESKAADEKFLTTLTADCKETAASWEERQSSAHAEMGAINKATEILSEGVRVFMQVGQKNKKGDGDLDKDEKDFDDTDAPAPVDEKRQKVVEKLKQLSSKYGSYALMELAGTAASDPFVKVKGLIEEMIAKLVKEANEEATQEAFCQEEISKSNAAKDEKTMTSDGLASRISKAASTKALLQQKVKELEGEIAELDSGIAEATKLRTAEKASNTKAASDFKLAAESVEKAIKVLKEYYETASFIQVQAKGKQPEFGEAKSDASHAIISILEMSGEDFTKMLMETETAETDAEAAYAQLALDTKVSKAAKSAEVKGSLSEIKSLDVALKNHKEDLDMTQKELSAVMEYLEKLKPQCESKVMSYAEKKARREEEIAGLKEALSILEGDAVLMQKSVHKHFLN